VKPLAGWLGSGFVTALLAMAIATTLLGNRGDESVPGNGGWVGGSAPLLAFSFGALPMTLAHLLSFLYLRRRDPMRLRMARATAAGLAAFFLAIGILLLIARH
jgi:vacuolar-type H+-ATPase subunit I/STV1